MNHRNKMIFVNKKPLQFLVGAKTYHETCKQIYIYSKYLVSISSTGDINTYGLTKTTLFE